MGDTVPAAPSPTDPAAPSTEAGADAENAAAEAQQKVDEMISSLMEARNIDFPKIFNDLERNNELPNATVRLHLSRHQWIKLIKPFAEWIHPMSTFIRLTSPTLSFPRRS